MAIPPNTVPGATDPRTKAFEKKRTEILRQRARTDAATLKAISGFIKRANERISLQLASVSSDLIATNLTIIQNGVKAILAELGENAGARAAEGASQAWAHGVDLLDEPLLAGGIRISALVPEINTQALIAMRSFLTGKMSDVSGDMLRKVNDELGLVLIGAQNASAAATAIQNYMGGVGRQRALRIVYTEVGTAFSAASQARFEQASEYLPGLKKQWRRSKKLHPRTAHVLADGQIVDVDKPFSVGGEKPMFPRDPKLTPKNRISCGCTSLPYMDNWEVTHPLNKPFAAEDVAKSKTIQNLDDARDQAFKRWVGKISSGRSKPTGNVETAGVIPRTVFDMLRARGLSPVSAEIGLSDRRILHMVRDAKKSPVPVTQINNIGYHLERPAGILLERTKAGAALIYVARIPGQAKLMKIPVVLRDTQKSNRIRTHNFVQTATMIGADQLRAGKYEWLMGGV